ncbi:hypothetical protein [Sphingobacterium sp. xlx-130]|uniref:hypothetical protein n=1 Tax=Sphingobacterium sp. xlx-130 TaxID=2654323 RepID=UPI0013D8F42D|nr:hypothetical protein [Sphingobacterium sp. xlx-130]
MKKLLYIFILFFAFTLVQAQTADDKAKAYYQQALKAFEIKNYLQALDYCRQVTDLLKTTNARIEHLRIKSYYELGEYDKVKSSVEIFSNLPAQPELKEEAFEYLVKIEEKEKAAEEKRLADNRRLQEELLAIEQRLANEKIKQEQAEAKSYADAMSGDVSAIRRFLKSYPNHQGEQNALNLLESQEERAYNNALVKDDIGVYEDYLKTFYDGKHKNLITDGLSKAKEKKAYEKVVRANSVVECETYLNTYPSGANKAEVMTVYEKTLYAEGQQALLLKDYERAETLYEKYKTIFPQGSQIKMVQAKLHQAQSGLKRKAAIAARRNKTYYMLSYGTNKSFGVEVGGLKVSHALSVYWGLNYSFPLPGFSSPIELESLDAYSGDEDLKKSFAASSFGFTMKVAYPLWAYAGAGVRYQTYEDGTDSYKLTGEKTWQVYPEVGLKGMIGKGLVLKAGVQLFKEKPVVQFGVGF